MHFVPVKSKETQGAAMVFRVRELLIRQNASDQYARGHLAEFGQIVPPGASNALRLIAIVEDPDGALPADAIPTLKALITALTHREAEIDKLDNRSKLHEDLPFPRATSERRLLTMQACGYEATPKLWIQLAAMET